MESIVLTALYKKPKNGPPTANAIIGAITPSEVFSATVSTAAFVTPASSRHAVSRPTIMETACLASSIVPVCKASYTFMLSTFNDRIARI